MNKPFEYFVIFAEMRTGSNFLEENLNEYPGLECHGELFNPHFLGGPKKTEKFGVTLGDRANEPLQLIEKLKEFSDGVHGFRFFHDHDPRVLEHCLEDRRCAKIILTRNLVESYVSREIARKTQQWRLGDLKNAKSAKISFDEDEFSDHLDRHRNFQQHLLTALQVSGQTAFYLAYEDLNNSSIINGLSRFLGNNSTRKSTAKTTKKQNPEALDTKVMNFPEMEKSLASFDYFALNRIPNFEPRRGPSVPKYITASAAPLLFLPIQGAPIEPVKEWLAKLDHVQVADLMTGFTQKQLRHWKRKAGNHRVFTVLRHPVARLHEIFVRRILMHGPDCFSAIRETLRTTYDIPIPENDPDQRYYVQDHRDAFVAFSEFIKGNLNGQTGIRVDAYWATQAETLTGFGQFMIPDYVFREDDLPVDMPELANRIRGKPTSYRSVPIQSQIRLEEIYDSRVEKAVRSAYQRDYMMFGFGPWKP